MKNTLALIFLVCLSTAAQAMSPAQANKLFDDGMKAIQKQDFEMAQKLRDELRAGRARRQALELQRAIDSGLRKGFAGMLRDLPDQITQLNEQRKQMTVQIKNLRTEIELKTKQGQSVAAERDQLKDLLQQQKEQAQQYAEQANTIRTQFEAKINDLVAQTQATDKQKADLTSQIEALRKEIVQKDSELAKYKQDVSPLQSQAQHVSAEKTATQELQTENADIQQF